MRPAKLPWTFSESSAAETCTWKFKTLQEELRGQHGVQGAARSVPGFPEGALRCCLWVTAAEEEIEAAAAEFIAVKLLTLCSVAIDAALYAR